MTGKKTIGLVLSGGGVRGAAHAGILKALLENNIEPTQLSGSSAGAMVAALYAVGTEPDEICEFFKTHGNVFHWQHIARNKPGFLDSEKYGNLLLPWLKEHTFESLPKPLYICVTDVLNGRIKFFSSGELLHPILASAAVPGVFTPVEIEDTWYIDGGTMNNFPVEPLVGCCDYLIGSFVSSQRAIEKQELSNTYKLISRANNLALLAGSQAKFGLCDFLFNPNDLWKYNTFDSRKVDEIFQIGYDYASSKMDQLLEIIYSKEKK